MIDPVDKRKPLPLEAGPELLAIYRKVLADYDEAVAALISAGRIAPESKA